MCHLWRHWKGGLLLPALVGWRCRLQVVLGHGQSDLQQLRGRGHCSASRAEDLCALRVSLLAWLSTCCACKVLASGHRQSRVNFPDGGWYNGPYHWLQACYSLEHAYMTSAHIIWHCRA